MNLTPATNEQKRALLEGNLNQAARLLFPRDQPLTVLFNLTMVWAFAAICTLVIPVILIAIMAIGLALMPIMILRALMRPKKVKPAIDLSTGYMVGSYEPAPMIAATWNKADWKKAGK